LIPEQHHHPTKKGGQESKIDEERWERGRVHMRLACRYYMPLWAPSHLSSLLLLVSL